MTRETIGTAAMLLLLSNVLAGAQQTTAPASQQTPPGTQPAPATAPSLPRTFTAPVGLLFNTVRPERVADFEKLIAYLQAALMKATDPTIREQARGWRTFKAAETGPNGTILYVFAFDPTVTGADYGLGRILADAYPDTAQLQEIWKLYTTSVTSGGSLLNLSPVSPDPAVLTEPRQTPPVAAPATPQTPPRNP